MPAAAVIPAPIAYIKVVAVKKLVVGFLAGCLCPKFSVHSCLSILLLTLEAFTASLGLRYFTLRKLECFRQASAGIH